MSGFDETFDFVVVGSGGGSMCAGLLMRDRGLSVLILEKSELVGGTTARGGAILWIPNNPFMKRDGVEDSYEAAEAYLDALIGDRPDWPGATRERRRTYLVEGPRMVQFLIDHGVKLTRERCWPDYYDQLPGGSAPGRGVTSALFNVNELGAWKSKLRPNFTDVASPANESTKLRHMSQSWLSRYMLLKLVLRTITAKLTGKKWVGMGAALQGQMLREALRAGVDFRLNAPVTELIVEDGAVKGVVATIDGRRLRVGARLGVLVNAGGFARNQRMRDLYQPGTSAKHSFVVRTDTGDMIEEMMRQGAAVAQMDEMVGFPITVPPGKEDREIQVAMQFEMASPHAILVDQTGVRYLNESQNYMADGKAMLERNKLAPAIPSWLIFDSQMMRKYMIAETLPGTRKPKRWYQEGYLRRASSIAELAHMLHIDPVRLEHTVKRFNGFVAKGRDDDFHRGKSAYDRWTGDPFHKPSPSLGPIDKAPYYALPIYPGDVSTYGGVVTDAHARVLRTDGSVIPGLYATGVSTASVMGGYYPGPGGSAGPSFVWGYVAAKHAANADNVGASAKARSAQN
jgi:3-oxosteroid 1-dehydrogenase